MPKRPPPERRARRYLAGQRARTNFITAADMGLSQSDQEEAVSNSSSSQKSRGWNASNLIPGTSRAGEMAWRCDLHCRAMPSRTALQHPCALQVSLVCQAGAFLSSGVGKMGEAWPPNLTADVRIGLLCS